MTAPRIDAVARRIGHDFDRAPVEVQECWRGMAREYLEAADAADKAAGIARADVSETAWYMAEMYHRGYADGGAFEAKRHAEGVCHEC